MAFFGPASGASSSRTAVQAVYSLSARAKSTSTMGISRKAVNSVKKTGSKQPKRRDEIKEPWYFNYRSNLAVLPEGRLDSKRMSALVDLYHSTSTHVTRENLDAYIDAEFAPESGVPKTRPQMASLIDLHIEMNDPGFYARPENDWRRIKAESALAAGSAADGIDDAFRNLAGTPLANALPASPAASTSDKAALNERPNDWIGARERELTPRQRLVVETLYGTDASRRPGLEGISERLRAESALESLSRAEAVSGQKAALADAGEAVQALDSNIKLEPHVGPAEDALIAEEDPVTAEGVAEGGDVAPEEILTKEGEAKP